MKHPKSSKNYAVQATKIAQRYFKAAAKEASVGECRKAFYSLRSANSHFSKADLWLKEHGHNSTALTDQKDYYDRMDAEQEFLTICVRHPKNYYDPESMTRAEYDETKNKNQPWKKLGLEGMKKRRK